MTLIDPTQPTWPYLLGQAFLAAITGCGFDCDRVFVAPGAEVEGLPPDCPCQVAVVVDAKFRPERPSDGGMTLCTPLKMATVTVVLDMCTIVKGQTAVATPVENNMSAQVTLEARWKIITGLQRARANGNLGGGCNEVTPDSWHSIFDAAGMARWQTSWDIRI